MPVNFVPDSAPTASQSPCVCRQYREPSCVGDTHISFEIREF